uniref:PLOD1-3-like GT domain-containing protein n=1 Tax=viral metagenome TaxID=1070528 RepID=A0A6C0D2A4_9ZZZZ
MQNPPAFYYITVATKPHQVLNKIIETVNQNEDESIMVLGQQENRFIGWEGNQNFGVKLREVADFLKRPDLDANDIVLFTDAYDVAYLGKKANVIARYLTFIKPIVFGSERCCNPDPHLAGQYPYQDNEFPFLNSGMFIGRVWALRKCLEDYQYDDRHDDQRYWTDQFLNKHGDLIELDYENKLFLNTVDIDMRFFYQLKQNMVTYKNRNPLFVHVNGPDKRMILNFL